MSSRLRVKRVYDEPAPGDGARVLVDRIWPRGLARQDARLDLWAREVAPSDALRKWFGHDPARWEQFRRRYRAELAARPEVLEPLRALLLRRRVTLLFGARDPEHNQAVVLAEHLEETRPRSRRDRNERA